MDWYLWLGVGLLLLLLEALTGTMALLALGIATAGTAVASALDLGLTAQLLTLATLSGILLPVAIWVIRPRFTPQGARYGTTGTGAQAGKLYQTQIRDYDNAAGIVINGDFFRVHLLDDSRAKPEADAWVELVRFEGTIAIARTATLHKNSEEGSES